MTPSSTAMAAIRADPLPGAWRGARRGATPPSAVPPTTARSAPTWSSTVSASRAAVQ